MIRPDFLSSGGGPFARVARWGMVAAFLSACLHAANFTWTGSGGDGDWGSAGNYLEGTIAFGNATDVFFHNPGAGKLTDNFTGGDRVIRSLNFTGNADSAVTIRTMTTATSFVAGNLTFNGGGSGASLNVANGAEGNFTIGSGTAAGNGSAYLADNLAVSHSGNGTLFMNHTLLETGGNRSITKNGTGALQFSGGSSFTGGLTIKEGTVIAPSGVQGDLGGAQTITLAGGTLLFQKGLAVTYNNKHFATTANTTSTLIYHHTNAGNDVLTIAGSGNGYVTTLNGDLLIRNISSAGGADAIGYAQNIKGAGKLSFEGNNDLSATFSDRRLQLSGNNTDWSGSFEIRKGSSNFSSQNSSGSGTIILGVSGGTDGAALYNDAGGAVFSNPFIVSSGSGARFLRNAAGGSVNWSGGFLLEGSLSYDASATVAGTDLISGNLTGAGSLIKTGDQTLTLTRNNTYTGGTTIAAGTLRITGGNALPNAGPVTLAGGTLDSQGSAETAGPLVVSENSAIQIGTGAGTLAFADSRAQTWTGILEITGTLLPRSIRFGTNSGALTSAHLSRIFLYSATAMLDSEGYLITVPLGTLTGSNQLDDNLTIILNQSTLDVNGFEEKVGLLDLDDDSKILLHGGTLAFSDSSAVDWKGWLDIVGQLGAQSIRFGTNASGLTATQLARIRHGGSTVYLDAAGYLRRVDQITRHSYVGGPDNFGYSWTVEDFNWSRTPTPALSGGMTGLSNNGDGTGRFEISGTATAPRVQFTNSPYAFSPKAYSYLRLGYRSSFSANLNFWPSPANSINQSQLGLADRPSFSEATGKFLSLALTDPADATVVNPFDSNGVHLEFPVGGGAKSLEADYLMVDAFPTLGVDEFNRQSQEWTFGNLANSAVSGRDFLTGTAGPAAADRYLSKTVDVAKNSFNALEIRVMRGAGSVGPMRLRWHARDVGWFTAEWQPESDGRYFSYMIDLGKCSEWTESQVTDLRIDLFDDASANQGKAFGIDFIRLRRLPELGAGVIHSAVNLGEMLKPRYEPQWDYVLSKTRYFRSVAGQTEHSSWRGKVSASAKANDFEVVIDGRQPWWRESVDLNGDGVNDYNYVARDANGRPGVEEAAQQFFQYIKDIAASLNGLDPATNQRLRAIFPDNALYVLMFPNGTYGLGGGFYEAVDGNTVSLDATKIPAAQAMAVDCYIRMMQKLRADPDTRDVKVYCYIGLHVWEWNGLGREHSANASNPGNLKDMLDLLLAANAAAFPNGDSPLVGFAQDFPWQYYRQTRGRKKLGEYIDYAQSHGFRYALTCNGVHTEVSDVRHQSYEAAWRYAKSLVGNGLRPDEVHAYEWTSNYGGDYETTLLSEHEDADYTYMAATRRAHDQLAYGLPPARPAVLSVVHGSQGVTISWDANQEYDVAGYHVERAAASEGPYTRLTTSLIKGASYTDTAAAPDSENFYRVAVVDTSNHESLPSAGMRPHAPSNTRILVADDFDNQTNAGWFSHISPVSIVADTDDDSDGVPAGEDLALKTAYQATGSGANWLRYFTPAGSPVKLHPGDRLTVEWQAKQTGFSSAAVSNYLRFGLVDSHGLRISTNEAYASAHFTNYDGYKVDVTDSRDDVVPYSHGVIGRRTSAAGTYLTANTGHTEIPGLCDMIAMQADEWTPVQRLSIRREPDGWWMETALGGRITADSVVDPLVTSQRVPEADACTRFDGFFLRYSSATDAGSPDFLLDNFKVILERAPGRVIPSDLAADSTIHLAFGQYLDLIEGDAGIGGLSGEGSVDMAGMRLTVGTNNEDTAFSGIINGAGSFVKMGTGTLALSGNSSFSGEITVREGDLRVSGAIGAATLIVGANGTLSGGGNIGGSIIMSESGALGSTGILEGAAIQGGGVLSFDLSTPAAAHDRLEVGGSLTFNAASTLVISGSEGAAPGLYTLVSTTGGILGSLPTHVILPAGWTADSPVLSGDGLSLEIRITSLGGGYSEWATVNAGSQAANLDFDGDGLDNGAEYFMGTAGKAFTPNPAAVSGTITWPRAAGTSIRSFKVEVSNNLNTWTDALVTYPANVAITTSQVSFTLPRGAGRIFVRLSVTP